MVLVLQMLFHAEDILGHIDDTLHSIPSKTLQRDRETLVQAVQRLMRGLWCRECLHYCVRVCRQSVAQVPRVAVKRNT